MTPPKRAFERLKQDAKAMRKREEISHAEALERVARDNGFPNWKAVFKAEQQSRVIKQPTPSISQDFLADSADALDQEDLDVVERTAELPDHIKSQVAANKAYLAAQGIEYSLFEPTITGLKKSILDATRPVRQHFELEQFHCFEKQEQGPAHRKLKDAYFVTQHEITPTTVSLYRPLTKKGDPRMWFRGLPSFACPEDQIAIVIFKDAAYLFNFSQTSLADFSPRSLGQQILDQYCASRSNTAEELLALLREIAKNPIKANVKGDTAVGMAIEAALGIQPNSSRNPDYKGIEIKSGRGGKSRTTLFAQVADWRISQQKSSAEILKKYGYQRNEDFKLYCTVSTLKANSQGLRFVYESNADLLVEKDIEGNGVAAWPGQLLRQRLEEKHAETFWIHAKSTLIDGDEYLTLMSVTHTKKPLITQLLPLIESGVITMDHLIKRKGGGGNTVSEKGPLFKMNKRDLSLLFPAPIMYTL